MNTKEIARALGKALANNPAAPDSIASSFAHFSPDIKQKEAFVLLVLEAKRQHFKTLKNLGLNPFRK